MNTGLSGFVRNIGWNLLGQAAPMAAALLSIPVMIAYLGAERFGLVAIGWMLIGYFSLFDFGLGRALTQVLSRYIADGRAHEQHAVLWSALALMGLMGLAAGAALYLLAPWLVQTVLNVPAPLQAEARAAIAAIAPAIPFVVVSTALRGVLEACQNFKLLNLVRTPLGVLTYAAPLLVLPFSTSLVPVFAVMGLVRMLTVLLLLWACVRTMADFWTVRIEARRLPELLRYGGWLTVTNVIGPVMVNMDRFFIASVLSLAAVAYYTTPFEMITRLLVVPGAIAGVCFPMFAQLAGKPAESRALYRKSVRYSALFLALSCGFVAVFAHAILNLWLGPEFAAEGADALRWLALGVAINGVAHIPYALVQGSGDARATALFHLLELAVYLPLLYVLIRLHGITGVAIAWCVRVTLDAALLFALANHKLRSVHAH
ncbi:MAG TPA: flippase [Burkholderiaceae bacterium]